MLKNCSDDACGMDVDGILLMPISSKKVPPAPIVLIKFKNSDGSVMPQANHDIKYKINQTTTVLEAVVFSGNLSGMIVLQVILCNIHPTILRMTIQPIRIVFA